MYKIAVMGDRDSIYGFAAIGMDIFPVVNYEEAAKLFKRLAESQYAVIYMTEDLHEKLDNEIERYRNRIVPAVIPIPGAYGNTGKGMRDIKKSVERAVGSDIIFNNENKEAGEKEYE
ncbi:MAG: V-type ATP synthase subunit F [Eubacteriales bacterium]|nr:V-type ATP synthase subunit F [Eubacteriales bacterium]